MCEIAPSAGKSDPAMTEKKSDNDLMFNGIAERFMNFCERFAAPFRVRPINGKSR